MGLIGDLRRFDVAPRFMTYLCLVPTEHSRAGRRHTGAITKAGNRVVRRALIENVCTYRFGARETPHLQRKEAKSSDYVKGRAWQAQKRLCHRYKRLIDGGKNANTAVTAVARELAGYVWDIATHEMAKLNLYA